jgi:hypothetical protein
MPARWNDELTYKYVELYKERECLWNMNSTQYKRKDARQSALEQTVRNMGLENFTTEDAKKKIKSLRETYQQESHKIDRSVSSGAGLEGVYKPSMKWFALMTSRTPAICTSSNLDTFLIFFYTFSCPFYF